MLKRFQMMVALALTLATATAMLLGTQTKAMAQCQSFLPPNQGGCSSINTITDTIQLGNCPFSVTYQYQICNGTETIQIQSWYPEFGTQSTDCGWVWTAIYGNGFGQPPNWNIVEQLTIDVFHELCIRIFDSTANANGGVPSAWCPNSTTSYIYNWTACTSLEQVVYVKCNPPGSGCSAYTGVLPNNGQPWTASYLFGLWTQGIIAGFGYTIVPCNTSSCCIETMSICQIPNTNPPQYQVTDGWQAQGQCTGGNPILMPYCYVLNGGIEAEMFDGVTYGGCLSWCSIQ